MIFAKEQPLKTAYVLPIVVLWLVVFVAYNNIVSAGFVGDDLTVVVGNDSIKSIRSVLEMFYKSYWKDRPELGLYRPVTAFTYAINYFVGGLNPSVYHLFNLLLHAVNTTLFYLLSLQCTQKVKLAFAASLLFAVHPAHVEAVSNIAARPELLVGFFLFVSVLAYLHCHRGIGFLIVSLFSYALGLLSKENAITLLGILILLDISLNWTGELKTTFEVVVKRLKIYSLYIFITICYLTVRFAVLKQIGVVSKQTFFQGDSFTTRLFTMSHAFIKYFELMLWPQELVAHYDFALIPYTKTLTLTTLLYLFIIVATVVVGFLIFKKNRLIGFSILIFFVTLSPISNILFTSGLLVGERALYVPLVSVCLIVGFTFDSLSKKSANLKILSTVLLIVLTFAASLRTYNRNFDWKDTESSMKAFISSVPDSPRTVHMLAELGERSYEKGDYQSAEYYFRQAIEKNRTFFKPHYNLGILLRATGRYNEAVSYLATATELEPKDFDARLAYATLLLRERRFADAIGQFKQALLINPKSAEVHNNIAIAYAQNGAEQEAITHFEEALRLNPDYTNAARNLESLKKQRLNR